LVLSAVLGYAHDVEAARCCPAAPITEEAWRAVLTSSNRTVTSKIVDKLATNIKRARRRRGWTQGDLAERAGITREYLARIETGRHDPRLSVAVKIRRALRMKAGDLLK
jgi:DNA-binding XRE family transcriptional regulator